MTKPHAPDIWVYTVLRLDTGDFVPAKMRLRNGMVRETKHIVEPCPYRALAYQALEAAIAQEYLADALRAPIHGRAVVVAPSKPIEGEK